MASAWCCWPGIAPATAICPNSITLARRRAPKGGYRLEPGDLGLAELSLAGCLVLWLAEPDATRRSGRHLVEALPGRVWIGVTLHRRGGDRARLVGLRRLGAACGLPLVAAMGVRMHGPERGPLLDILTAIRLGTRVEAVGEPWSRTGRATCRAAAELARFYPPDLLAQTARVAAACRFSLDELRYEYPDELVPPGETPAAICAA